MEGNYEAASSDDAQHAALKNEFISRVIRDFEEAEAFDAMEIARALLAVAFARMEVTEPVETATRYYNLLQNSCKDYLARREAFIRAWATEYEAEKAVKAKRKLS